LFGNKNPNNKSKDSKPITPSEVRKKMGNITNLLPRVFGKRYEVKNTIKNDSKRL
jgi:hypothetical protein